MAAILKLRPTGSPSQFGDGGIHFSCSDKSQEQNKIGFTRSWGGGGGCTGVYQAHGLLWMVANEVHICYDVMKCWQST